MSDVPSDLRFLKSHEWARLEDDGRVRVGISDHAQEALGDLVFVELPEVGDDLEADQACAVVESVKAASDVYAPIAGEVVEVNETLNDSPELVNEAAYGDDWLFCIQPADAGVLDGLLDAEAYGQLLDSE